MNRSRVLFLCTGNSCRSHMAEGWMRHLAGDRFHSFSAGTRPAGFVHPLGILAMSEVGVDISGHRSKSLDEFAGQSFDVLVTVCDGAREACPVFAGARHRAHWGFDDPARAVGSDAEKMRVFRRVRDEIGARVRRFLDVQSQEMKGKESLLVLCAFLLAYFLPVDHPRTTGWVRGLIPRRLLPCAFHEGEGPSEQPPQPARPASGNGGG